MKCIRGELMTIIYIHMAVPTMKCILDLGVTQVYVLCKTKHNHRAFTLVCSPIPLPLRSGVFLVSCL